MRTPADRMAHALELVLAMPGREEHPRDVSLSAVRLRGDRNHLVRLSWEDAATGESAARHRRPLRRGGRRADALLANPRVARTRGGAAARARQGERGARMSGAKKKTAASEGGSAELRRHAELMREMDSPNGAWNPEPDAQITALLREDVILSANEIKLVALVKSCCIQLKPGGRSAWGKLDGKPLTLSGIQRYFEWDDSNVSKHAARLLAYGFIRRNEVGYIGLGARVEGSLEGEEKENDSGMYIPEDCQLPGHLTVAVE